MEVQALSPGLRKARGFCGRGAAAPPCLERRGLALALAALGACASAGRVPGTSTSGSSAPARPRARASQSVEAPFKL